MKWYATACVVVSRVTQDGDMYTATPYFHSETILELTNERLSVFIEDIFEKKILINLESSLNLDLFGY